MRLLKFFWWSCVAVFCGLVLSFSGAFLYLSPGLPSVESLRSIQLQIPLRVYSTDGKLIAEFGEMRRSPIRFEDIPPDFIRALLAAEDDNFANHYGVDFTSLVRAATQLLASGHIQTGGSTITMQVAKNFFLTNERSFSRKTTEILLALQIERELSKDEILELYINRTFFGANTFGIDGASRTYFGKPASQLTLSEAALLASLPKAPSRMALNRNMAGALARQRLVLNNMREENWITDQDLQAAIGDTPKLSPTALANDGDMGYALDFATNEVLKIVGPNSPDLMVRLTIDPRLQATGGNVLRQVVGSAGSNGGASQGALFAMSSEGAIRAMVGGLDYNQSVFNRAVQARRQPGSSFKPLVYAAALEKGVMPTDVRVDGPVKFGDWEPENYGGGYRGAVTIETALALSINTVAVKLAQEAGGRAISELASRFGVTTLPPNPDLSVALGAYEVPLNEMVSAFQVFQTGGNRVTPYIVDEIKTVDGAQVYLHLTSNPVPAYDIARASMMVKMMKKVIAPGGTGSRADFGRPAAGKTGTSQNWRDAWFIGFTPDYIAGVWVGNDDEKPMNRLTGGVVSAEIWRKFMMVAHETLPARDFDWLLPDPVPETEADPRNAFYDELSSDFAAAAREAQASTPETPDETQDKPAEDIPF